MLKIIIINHTFQKPEFCKRWEVLANNHKDLDITLLAPHKMGMGKSENSNIWTGF